MLPQLHPSTCTYMVPNSLAGIWEPLSYSGYSHQHKQLQVHNQKILASQIRKMVNTLQTCYILLEKNAKSL